MVEEFVKHGEEALSLIADLVTSKLKNVHPNN